LISHTFSCLRTINSRYFTRNFTQGKDMFRHEKYTIYSPRDWEALSHLLPSHKLIASIHWLTTQRSSTTAARQVKHQQPFWWCDTLLIYLKSRWWLDLQIFYLFFVLWCIQAKLRNQICGKLQQDGASDVVRVAILLLFNYKSHTHMHTC
jgi:hypothetical protein